MREIKFRAWDKKQKAFINGFNMIGFSTGQGAPNKKLQRFSDYWNLDEVELMQYTGLKDKKGKEIYEGDILHHKWDSGSGIKETVSEVKFSNGSFICDDRKRADFELSIHALGTYAEIEVIGNIYKNPVY